MKLLLNAISGLSARLLAIISGYRLAKLSNRELEVIWNITRNETPCYFQDLFENPKFKISDGNMIYPLYEPFDVYSNEKIVTVSATRQIDNNWGVPDDEDLYEYCNILRTKSHILGEVDSFVEKHRLSDAVGVHLRRNGVYVTDNCNVPQIALLNSKLKQNPTLKIFLTSDCKDTIDIFTQLFWGNIVTYPENTFKRNSLRDMEVALINILILSRCNYIVRSGLSGFSHLAVLLGKKPNIIL